jgi:hypothetical protein
MAHQKNNAAMKASLTRMGEDALHLKKPAKKKKPKK